LTPGDIFDIFKVRPFMPRDSDKHNDSRGRRDRPPGGKGRSGKARGPEKKFAKRGFGANDFAGKGEGEKRPYRRREDGDAPRRDFGDKPRFNRDDRPRGERSFGDRPSRGGEGEKRTFKPRGDRPGFDRDDRGGEKRPYTPRANRDDARPAGRFSGRKFGDKKPYASRDHDGDKRPYAPRGERSFGDRPPRHGDRPVRKFGGDKKFSRGDRGPRKDFGDRPPRGESRPWQKRKSGADRPERNSRPSRDGARNFDRPKFDKPRYDRPREERGGDERPRFARSRDDRQQGDRPFRERPKFDRPREGREDSPKFDRPRRDRDGDTGRPEGRRDWQEHPRSDGRFADRPRRDNEDDSKVFAKRPAFGGRGAYRERAPEFEKRAPRPPKEKKSGERIAKVMSRAGLASRRDAEEWVIQGRVTVNGRVINSPALDVTANDVIAVDGKPLPPRERTRLFMFHKPRGLMTTHADPEGRPTVFDNLPEGLPRLISIGRLDFNTEGLLLLTNDGGLARALELPDTGWLRR
jgi:23S rRNA pseudouridine2605 synthase